MAPQDPQLAERLSDMGKVVQQLQGLGSDLVRATGEIRTQLEHCHGQTQTVGGIVNECVKALDDHTTNLRQAATAREHLQAAGLALESTVAQVKATLQAHQDSLVHAVSKFEERATTLESRVNVLDTALGGLRGRVEQVERTTTANQRKVQQSLQEHTREIAAMQHFLSNIRGVPEHLTDLQARVYTLEGPDARARVVPDPTADYNVRLQSVENKVAQLKRVPQAVHSAMLPTRGATVTPSKLLEAEGRMQTAAEQCVRQHYTTLHERFTSLEQEVSRRVTSVELAQAALQAKPEVALPPEPTTGSSYEPLEHQVCELDSRVTGVQDDLWQLQATVGGLVHLTRSPGKPQASAAPVWGLGAPVDTASPLWAEVPSATPATTVEPGASCGVYAAGSYAREAPLTLTTTYPAPPPLHGGEILERQPVPQPAAPPHPGVESWAGGGGHVGQIRFFCLHNWLDSQDKFDPFAFLDYLENVGDGEVGVSFKVRPSGVPDNRRAFEEVLLDDIPSTNSTTAPGSLFGGLLGPQLAALLDPNQLKATQANTRRPTWDGEGATARDYWRDWLLYENNVNHMQPEHLQKEALLQNLPASRQNVLRKRCTRRLIGYQELKTLVKTQIDRAMANYGASKNWEDIVPPHPATANSLTEWFDDWGQAGARVRGGVSHHMAKRQFLKAMYVSNAYEGHLDAMVFEEAKQNSRFSYLKAFCFILPRQVSKKRAKVTKQNIVGEARAVNAIQPHGRGQPCGRGKGKGGADTGTPNPTPGNGGTGTPDPRQCTACGRTGHTEAQCWERHPHLRPAGKGKGTGAGDGIPPGTAAPGNPPPGGPRPQVPYCPECGRGRHPPELCWQKHPELREAAMRAGKAGKGRGAGRGKGQ